MVWTGFSIKRQFYGPIVPMKPTMTMIITSSSSLSSSSSYLLGVEITHDGNWEAVYGCEDEQNMLSCDF